jgi:3-oxoacyl-[acyl-carrier protein] reductase
MLLKNKNAIVYGGAGAVGGAVARAFAGEGARVFLAGRTLSKLDKVAAAISASGGQAETAVVDAHNKQSVEEHVKQVVQKAGSIDISFNAVGIEDIQGVALTDMAYDEFVLPVIRAMSTQFITATAVARYMEASGTGVIMMITANVARKPYEHSGGFGVACAAMEGLCRQLAVETGKRGVRVVCLRSAGSPDAPGVDEAFRLHAEAAGVSREAFETDFAQITMLKRLPRLAEVANAAVLAASDKASAITAAVLNVTCGELAD